MGAIICIVFVMVVIGMYRSDQKKKRIKAAYTFDKGNDLGAAHFASERDLKDGGYFGRKGIELGFSFNTLKTICYSGPGHILLVAAARTGKAFTLIVHAILSLGRGVSLLVFDPKAELASVTGHWRKRFGRVYILNPFGIQAAALKGLIQARLNPMDILDPLSIAFHAACDKLAEALCPDESGGGERHWIIGARLLISGIIAALARFGDPAERNLIALRNIITGANGHSVYEFCRECMALDDPFIKQKLGRFAATGAEDNKELSGLLATADTRTGFLGNKAIADCLMTSNILPRDLRRKAGTSFFVCLPLNKLDVCAQFFSLIFGTFLSDLLEEGTKGKRGAKVIAIVDEASMIGPLRAFADAWGMAAGAAGLQIWAVYQGVSQIMQQFGENWQTIVQNSGVTMWFGARDPLTREIVSKLAGVTTVVTQSRSINIDPRTGEPVVSDGASQTLRPLLHPHEVGELGTDEMIMFAEGVPATIKAKRLPYTKTSRGRYRKNPYFQPEGFFGSWFR